MSVFADTLQDHLAVVGRMAELEPQLEALASDVQRAFEAGNKLLVFGTNGRFYTLGCDKLPRGRGFGEPLRLMIDLGNDQDIIAVLVHQEGRRLLVASSDGRGFVVGESDVIAQKRQGKQVLNLGAGAEAAVFVSWKSNWPARGPCFA